MKIINTKTKTTYGYLFILAFIGLFLLLLGLKDFLWVHLFFIVVPVVFAVIYTSMKDGISINYGTVTGAMGLIYICGPVLGILTGQVDKQHYLDNWTMVAMATVALICFFIGYNRNIKISINKPVATLNKVNNKHNYSFVKVALLVLLVVYLASKVYVMAKIGFNAYFSMGRAAVKKIILEKYSFLSILSSLGNFVTAFSLEMYFEAKKAHMPKKFFGLLFIVSTVSAVFFSILEIDRSNLILIVLPVAYLLSYHKVIKGVHIIVLGLATVFLLVVWKQFISNYFFNKVSFTDLNLKLEIPSESFTWFNIATDVKNKLRDGTIRFKNGYTYLKAFESILNPLFQNYEALSTWYVRTAYPEVYLKGGGMAFSCIVEAYINFGYLGAIIVFLPLGQAIKFIEQKVENSVYYRTFYALLISFVYKIFRSEIYSIVKLSFWLWAVPLIVLWLIDKKNRTSSIR